MTLRLASSHVCSLRRQRRRDGRGAGEHLLHGALGGGAHQPLALRLAQLALQPDLNLNALEMMQREACMRQK